MRIALFSDIHGNFTGTQAVLTAIKAGGGADMIIAAGDHLLGESGGDDLLDLLDAHQVCLIRGDNETEDKLDRLEQQAARNPGRTRNPRTYYTAMRSWFHEHVSSENRTRLAELPVSMTVTTTPNQKLFVCHASPRSTGDRVCAPDVPSATLQQIYGSVDANAIAFGHWHSPYVRWLNGRMYINVASVGFRPDGLSRYTILTSQDSGWVVEQKAVPYKVDTEVQRSRVRDVPIPAP